jgi:hypothetical protein
MTLSIITDRIMTLSLIRDRIMTLSTITDSIMTLSIITDSKMTLRINYTMYVNNNASLRMMTHDAGVECPN